MALQQSQTRSTKSSFRTRCRAALRALTSALCHIRSHTLRLCGPRILVYVFYFGYHYLSKYLIPFILRNIRKVVSNVSPPQAPLVHPLRHPEPKKTAINHDWLSFPSSSVIHFPAISAVTAILILNLRGLYIGNPLPDSASLRFNLRPSSSRFSFWHHFQWLSTTSF